MLWVSNMSETAATSCAALSPELLNHRSAHPSHSCALVADNLNGPWSPSFVLVTYLTKIFSISSNLYTSFTLGGKDKIKKNLNCPLFLSQLQGATKQFILYSMRWSGMTEVHPSPQSYAPVPYFSWLEKTWHLHAHGWVAVSSIQVSSLLRKLCIFTSGWVYRRGRTTEVRCFCFPMR